jgi:uncharacterized membrane protein
MTRRIDRLDALTFALLGLGSAITAAVYSRLPARVPVHFNIHGVADGWMSKPWGATILLLTCVIVWLTVRFGSRILAGRARERMDASPVKMVGLLTVGLFVVLQLLVLYSALADTMTIGRPLTIALGGYWIILAQVLPRVRRNPFIGIRTAWTLSSDENWARTHRFGAWAFSIGGVVAVLSGLLGAATFAMVAILVSAFAPLIFSIFVARADSA